MNYQEICYDVACNESLAGDESMPDVTVTSLANLQNEVRYGEGETFITACS